MRNLRAALREKHNLAYRELYRTLDNPGDHPLKKAQAMLDQAVREAYGMTDDEDMLTFLLKLNLELAEKEAIGESIRGPGLPATIKDRTAYVTKDCIVP